MNEMESITSLEQLEKYAGYLVYAEFGGDLYQNGFYQMHSDLVNFTDGSIGYYCTAELGADRFHHMAGISSEEIKHGVQIRFATQEEASGIVISYGRTAVVWGRG